MIKLHLFKGYENKSIGISIDTKVCHLYDTENDLLSLANAAKEIGLDTRYMQTMHRLFHFDVFGIPLDKAKKLYPIVSTKEMMEDMRLL